MHFSSQEDQFFGKANFLHYKCLFTVFFSPRLESAWMSWPQTDHVTHLSAPQLFFFFSPKQLTGKKKKKSMLFDYMLHWVLCWFFPLALLSHMHSRWYFKKQTCDCYVHSCWHIANHIMQWHLDRNWGKKPVSLLASAKCIYQATHPYF